jgi:hypothetical protein
MANSNNMYGANLKEYALDVLKNKQVARSTILNLHLNEFPAGRMWKAIAYISNYTIY